LLWDKEEQQPGAPKSNTDEAKGGWMGEPSILKEYKEKPGKCDEKNQPQGEEEKMLYFCGHFLIPENNRIAEKETREGVRCYMTRKGGGGRKKDNYTRKGKN